MRGGLGSLAFEDSQMRRTIHRNGMKYTRSFFKELNTMVAPLGVMIDGSLVDDDVREGVAADVSTFIRGANGQMTMGGLDMLLYVGARPRAEIYTGLDSSKPVMKIALTGVAQADAKTVFSRMRPLLVPARSNPSVPRMDVRKLITKLNRHMNTDDDIKYDPHMALRTILELGIAIGQADMAGEAYDWHDRNNADQAVDRLAGFYERILP